MIDKTDLRQENTTCPSRSEALKIWEKGIFDRCQKPYGFPFEGEYRFHTLGVAKAAEAIASHIEGMDCDKAYVLGLLHDYGKRISERTEGRFHGREGFEAMQEMGYTEVAKICLTHTFPNKDFSDDEFSYPQDWQDWSRQKLADIEYNDYDYLIALCDKFFEGMSMVSISKRVKGIVQRYGLAPSQEKILFDGAMRLKDYFDHKTGCDIYDILGIEE